MECRVFYSARCSFWTDDFSKLAKTPSGIPCCPVCKSVGFEMALKDWVEQVRKYSITASDADYPMFLAWLKHRCMQTMALARKEFDKLLKG